MSAKIEKIDTLDWSVLPIIDQLKKELSDTRTVWSGSAQLIRNKRKRSLIYRLKRL
jgi:hypothetical protein